MWLQLEEKRIPYIVEKISLSGYGTVKPPEFLAKVAIHAADKGHMKDMPALLLAALTAQRSVLVPELFAQVVDNGKMLRNFVQILRSGVDLQSLSLPPPAAKSG